MKRILTIGFLAAMAWTQAIAEYSKALEDFEKAAPRATVDATVPFKQPPGDKQHSIVTGEGDACMVDLDEGTDGTCAAPGGAASCRASAIWGTLALSRADATADTNRTSGANLKDGGPELAPGSLSSWR